VELFFKWIKQNLRSKNFTALQKRREDSDHGSLFRLSDRGDNQKATQFAGKSLHNFTGFERLPFEMNIDISNAYIL
jgi:hypothetical protein